MNAGFRLTPVQGGEGETIDEETEGHRLETVLPEAIVMAGMGYNIYIYIKYKWLYKYANK